MGWIYFLGIELFATVLMVIGWPLLAILCALNIMHQEADGKWHYPHLFWLWCNEEDGLKPQWYNPEGSRWKAYLWSAWRNSSNNVRYLTLWIGGPFYRWESPGKGWYFQCGFKPVTGWPVLSAGRILP